MIIADVSDEQIHAACGEAPGLVCRNVFRWTENETVSDAAQWLSTTPLKVLLIAITALLVNRLVRRVISRSLQDVGAGADSLAGRGIRRLRQLTPRALSATGEQDSLRAVARAQTIGLVLKSVASIVIWSIAVMLMLEEVGINLAPLIAGAGIVGVALGFGAQSLVKDFLSGLFMLAEDQFGVGDVIDAGEATGVVEAVNLRTTRLRSVDGTVWHIPNGEITRVGNKSQQWARALVDVAVAYGTDLDLAQRVIKDVADEIYRDDAWRIQMLEEPEVWGIESLGADGIAVRVVIKTQPGEQWKVMRELRRRLKDRFDREGIEIPFPQRTVWVRRDEGSSRNEPVEGLDDAPADPAAGSGRPGRPRRQRL